MTLPTSYVVVDCETTGLSPLYGDRLTCIGARDNLGNSFCESLENEWALIQKFLVWLTARSTHTLVTANGRDFDVPFIVIRATLLGIPSSDFHFLPAMAHFDLQTVTKRKVSVDDMAKLYGFAGKSGNGFDAIRLWEHRKIDELKRYCMDDVLLTERLFLKYCENTGMVKA